MKPATITLGAASFLVVGTSSAIILRQHAQLEELRARLDSAVVMRAVAPAPIVAESAEPATEPANTEGPPTSPAGVTVLRLVGTEGEIAQQRPNTRQRGANRWVDLLADPEVAAAVMVQHRGELDGRYAALFKKLGLSPPEIDALKNLLAEKYLARMETNAVAVAEGLGGNDREAMQDLVRESGAEVEARMRELLGNDRYAALQQYESTAHQRARVQQLDLRLSYSQSPLQPFQSDALVGILAANPEPRPLGRLTSPEDHAGYLAEVQTYDSEIYSRAESVLNTAQLEVLRQLQKERQDRLLLQALMRRRGGG